jgi:hypothetical protein
VGAILASAIIAGVRITLLDPSPGTTWLDADLLSMLNQGQRNACLLRPDLYTVRAAIPMVAGTLQALPAGGTGLIRLDENVSGKMRCRLVDSDLFDAFLRTWPAFTRTVEVEEYAFDPKDAARFQVNPPNTGAGSVIAHYTAVPPAIAAVGNAITLDDTLELVLKHFTLGEAYAANTKRQDLSKATFYRQSFEKMLGINAQAAVAISPKYGNTPGGA